MSENPKTVREQITSKIRGELISGQFEAGSMLRETELASRFGVSRGPIRDAFIQLSNEGFLAYQANRGVKVQQPPDDKDRKFITSLRQQIEIYAVSNGMSLVGEEEMQSVCEAFERLELACTEGDAALVAVRDVEFHESILVACGGADFLPTWRRLCTQMIMAYSRLSDFREAFLEHQRIFDALESRNTGALVAALVANIR